MSITQNEKQEVIAKYQRAEGDTGSPEVQCAILTTRVQNLTMHLKSSKKDFSARRSLLRMVRDRKRLLSYLKGVDESRYLNLIQSLGIRK